MTTNRSVTAILFSAMTPDHEEGSFIFLRSRSSDCGSCEAFEDCSRGYVTACLVMVDIRLTDRDDLPPHAETDDLNSLGIHLPRECPYWIVRYNEEAFKYGRLQTIVGAIFHLARDDVDRGRCANNQSINTWAAYRVPFYRAEAPPSWSTALVQNLIPG